MSFNQIMVPLYGRPALGFRALQFGEAQSRLRARIGQMPGEAAWRHITEAPHLAGAIQRMREQGLGRWVEDLPRNPSGPAIEASLRVRVAELGSYLEGLVPSRWRDFGGWLRLGAELPLVEALLIEAQVDLPVRSDRLLGIATLDLERRMAAVQASSYGDCFTGDGSQPLAHWHEQLARRLPPMGGPEGRQVHRLLRLVTEHLQEMSGTGWSGERSMAQPDRSLGWRLRNRFGRRARSMLVGDPFHAGLLLIYGVLELLQAERCRALLLAQARGWRMPEILAGEGA